MADLTLRQALAKLQNFGPKVAGEIQKVMKEETPVGPTGNLEKSIYWEQTGSEEWFIGTKLYYAKWVENGRGPVRPKRAKRLHYFDYKGGKKSIHDWGTPNLEVWSMGVGPAKANDFVGDTKKRVEKMTFTL